MVRRGVGAVVAGFVLALALGSGAAASAVGCHAPALTGLSLAKARTRAAQGGCSVRVAGGATAQAVFEPRQLVRRQSPAAGAHTRTIEVWLAALCAQPAAAGAPRGEPIVIAGPTELISGVYLEGGPLIMRARCRPGTPSAGTVEVVDPQSGAVIASATVAEGRLATFPLAPGSYTVEGSLANGTSGGEPMRTRPQTVTIAAGQSVRQDTTVDVP